MTGHALTRIYTAPKQEPADTTHRPSISIHVRQTPPAPPPPPPGLVMARRLVRGMGSWAYSGAREKARPDPAHGRTRTGRFSLAHRTGARRWKPCARGAIPA